MRRLFVVATLLGGIVAMSGGLSAQQQEPKKGFDPKKGGGFGDFKLIQPIFNVLRSNPASLLMNKSVQEEIKLDEEQLKKLTEATKERTGNMQEYFAKITEKAKQLEGVPEDKVEAKVRELFKEEIETPMKDAEKVLKAEQLKRLNQIYVQSRGIALFSDANLAKTLKITEEQQSKAKEIQKELMEDLRELGGGRPGGGGRPMQPSKETLEKIKKVTDEAKEKATALLTAEQKTALKELSGEPFELKQERGFGFPGGGNRPGGRPTPKKDD